MRGVHELVLAIDDIVRSDAERLRSRDAALADAQKAAAKMPWTHRTGGERSSRGELEDWREIFRKRLLRAKPVRSGIERMLGLRRAVYFFVGSCAYPHGLAVLLFPFQGGAVRGGTFNPYDTGAVNRKILRPVDPRAGWGTAERLCHVASTMGAAEDLSVFLGYHISAHFKDPLDYVRRSQTERSDFEPYHGLTGGDRRTWTVEARASGDVPFEHEPNRMPEIWLESEGVQLELPDDLWKYSFVRSENMTLAESVAQRIEKIVKGEPA